MTLLNFTETAKTRLEKLFTQYLSAPAQPAIKLQQAMEYAVLNGGKRIRPLLTYLTGQALGASWENCDAPAAAIELIHVYSLIHDDLPAMDNADLRRGKPACHKAFGEATAILAGDALQTLAFEIIAKHPAPLSAQQRINMITTLSHAAGATGMAGGQALDLAGVDSLTTLKQMYQLKTGALLTASVKLGVAAAHTENHHSLEKFADYLGLAFQIQDDLLDIESTTEQLGKPQGIDNANAKLTYPILTSIEKSRQTVQELFAAALESITFLGKQATFLTEFAHDLMQRKK